MIISVTCALIENNGLVLVTQRGPYMDQPLRWEFPGGKVEPGETEQACLVREIKEELSITITPLTRLTPVLYPLDAACTLALIPYRCGYDGGTIQLLEHQQYCWAQPHDLPGYTWCAPDIPVVAEYLQLLGMV
ncbi:(deoxy)nucleoside triphosphate pyrophosphohydrolase [Pontibacter sp. CAU 1760]